jgi:hypothetical protein
MDTTDTDHTERSTGQSQDGIEKLSPDRSNERAARLASERSAGLAAGLVTDTGGHRRHPFWLAETAA